MGYYFEEKYLLSGQGIIDPFQFDQALNPRLLNKLWSSKSWTHIKLNRILKVGKVKKIDQPKRKSR